MSMRRSEMRAALVGLALLVAQPLGAANREHQQLMADIRMLQEQTQQLQSMLTTLTEAIKAVNGKLDEQAGINRKSYADQKLRVDNLGSDIRIVREKIDD